MPHLDDRLKTVAKHIRSEVHADIGSDHGYLLKCLLASGRIDRAIAIENKHRPFANSQATLLGLNAEVRLADGLNGLAADEANSLSICGMGGRLIVDVLQAFPDRVPPKVILQPNCETYRVRKWGLDAGYHLTDEQLVVGQRTFEFLCFEMGSGEMDPAYENVSQESALLLGPLHLKRWSTDFVNHLEGQQNYLLQLDRRHEATQTRLDIITAELVRHGHS